MTDSILQEALDAFRDCAQHEADNRADALDDLEFARLGKQWRDEDLRQRAEEKRPCLTINKLPSFIRQVVNDARLNSPSISARPVDGKADVATAEIISGLIRDIESQSDADIAYDTAVDSAVTCGFGYFRINLDYASDDTFEQDIRIRRVTNPFSIYGDPSSESADSSDWNIAFVKDRLDKKEFARRYPGASESHWDAQGFQEAGPDWIDQKTVGIAEYWKRVEGKRSIVALSNGEIVDLKAYEANREMWAAQGMTMIGSPREIMTHRVKQYLLTGAEVLEENDWAGKYIPIVPVYGEEINVNGVRHYRSLIRDAKDPQRMFNYWRTTSTELVALAPKAPFIGPKGTFRSDAEKWALANIKSYPYIEYDGPIPPQRQPFAGVPSGVMAEAMHASDDMKAIIGLFDASLGARSNEVSGVAINARKREGDVSTFHFIDNLSRAVRHGGRILIDLIPKVYGTPRIVRILGLDQQSQNVAINQPFQDNGLARIYDLRVGRYDVAIKTGPSFTTQREEAASQMMELLRVFPQAAPVIGDLVAEKLDWPGAGEIAKRLKLLLPQALAENSQHMAAMTGAPPGGAVAGQAAAAPDPRLLQAAQTAARIIDRLKAEVAEKSAELTKMQQENIVELFRARIEAYEAQTERMKVTGAPTVPPPAMAS